MTPRTTAIIYSYCALLFAAALHGAPAHAQPAEPTDTSDLEALLGESVVTTASRSAERASIAPSTVFTITAAEIFASGARTVDEALELCGLGIYVAKPRDYTTGIDVGAQGLILRDAGRHVLVMLDGMILNSQGTGRISLHEGLGVPIDLIDHIEVMLGPGSVIYGSNAMLAVINVVTRRARDLPKMWVSGELGSAAPQDDTGALTSAEGSRAGLRYRLSLGGGGRFSVGKREGEATVMAEWTHELSQTYGVTPFTMGEPFNQSFRQGETTWGGLVSHDMRAPSGALSVKLGDFRLLVSAFNYHRTLPLVGTFADPYALEEQNGVRLELSHSAQLGERFTLDSRLYGGYATLYERSNYGEDFWCIAGQSGCHFEVSAISGWVGAEQRLTADWRKDGRVVSMVGYDVRPRFFASEPGTYTDLITDQPSDVVPTPSSRDNSIIGAVFAQQVWRPLQWLALNIGARFDFQSQFGYNLSPRAAVVMTPGKTTTLRVSYNKAFRAPSQYELAEFDPTYRITPTDLRPETVNSVEVEAQQRVWRLNLSARGYASFYSDLIESRETDEAEIAPFLDRLSPSVDPSVVVVNDNITALKVFGGSGSAQVSLPVGLWASATFNIARAIDGDDQDYERMPLFFGNFRAGWRSGEDGYAVTVLGVYAGERRVLVNSTPTDFTLGSRLDLRLSASGPLGGERLKGLRFRASVGFALNPYLPYAVTVGTDTDSGHVLYPAQPRLSGFIGLTYALGGN